MTIKIAEVIKKLNDAETDVARHEIIIDVVTNLGKLKDIDRLDLIETETVTSDENPPLTLLQALATQYPAGIPMILETLTLKNNRSHAMNICHSRTSPLDLLGEKPLENAPPILKLLLAKDRLVFIRREESGSKEFGEVSDPKFKFINNIIFCDLYIEHLEASLSESNHCNSLFAPDEAYKKLTQQKIQAVEQARTILEDRPESPKTMQAFHAKLLENKQLLETRRDTWLTFFLKCVGVLCSGGLAYHSLFVNTDGKALLDKTDTHEPPANKSI
jgi:hypothetical protein